MNREDDELYYRHRAEQERFQAERSDDSTVRRVHTMLAQEYERRIRPRDAAE